MLTNPSGNVGINITTPSSTLTVQGNINITGNNNGSMFPDGTKQNTSSIPHGKQRSTANDTFTVPGGVTIVWVTVIGGGGGAGGGSGDSAFFGGGDGFGGLGGKGVMAVPAWSSWNGD